jgi:hypothetical protein
MQTPALPTKPARDKYPSLLRTFANYDHKKFFSIFPKFDVETINHLLQGPVL